MSRVCAAGRNLGSRRLEAARGDVPAEDGPIGLLNSAVALLQEPNERLGRRLTSGQRCWNAVRVRHELEEGRERSWGRRGWSE